MDGYSTYVETITTTFWGKYAAFRKKTLTFLLHHNINKKLQVLVKYKKHDQPSGHCELEIGPIRL